MSDKNRERTCNKQRYAEKQRKKKASQQQKQLRAVSRETRSYIRRMIAPYLEGIVNYTDRPLLIILSQTEKAERILFKVEDIGRGMTHIYLPTIGEKLIKDLQTDDIFSFERSIQARARLEFGIKAESVTENGGLLILEGCSIVEPKDGFIVLETKPYDRKTWYYNGESSLQSQGLYSGKQLNAFFDIDGKISKTYVHRETLLAILMYRTATKKLDLGEWRRDYDKEHYDALFNETFDKLWDEVGVPLIKQKIKEYILRSLLGSQYPTDN